MKALWKWEKHDVVNYLITNEIKEFTVEQLMKRVENRYYYVGCYSHTIISKLLHELSIDGFLKVKYFSQGSRTVAKYSRD